MKSFNIPLDFRHDHRLIRSRKVRVPRSIEIPVFLIRCELQNRMFYKHLGDVGLSGCDLEVFLDDLILAMLGMWDARDVTTKVYDDLMDKATEKITVSKDEATIRALKMYYSLVAYRDKMGIGLTDDGTRRTSKKRTTKN